MTDEEPHGPIAFLAEVLGCSQGRVYTILIGLVLSLAMLWFAAPTL